MVLYCIVYISLFQFSWVQYKEFQIIFTYNFFGYNQYELRVPFRLIFEGFWSVSMLKFKQTEEIDKGEGGSKKGIKLNISKLSITGLNYPDK